MESPPKITTRSVLPARAPTKSWLHHFTLDALVKVLIRTLFNPFLALILVLCLRAQVTPTTHPAWIIAVGYLVFLSVVFAAYMMNHRIADGMPRTVDSENEVVLITGGASGLGLAIAQLYGMKGASVAVLDIKEFEEGEAEATLGENVAYFKCDVGNRGELEIARENIEKELGVPTVIINCAAARVNGLPFLELSAEAIEKTLRTNLLAAFHLNQVFLPKIIAEVENGGTIVTISSVLGHVTPAGLSDYSASKAGLSALHRTLEAEFRGNERIKTLLVEIGQVSTPLFDWVKTPIHFLAPELEPVEVAREIVATVDGGQGGVLRLPVYAKFINWYYIVPRTIQLLVRYISGLDHAVSSGLQNRESPSTPDSLGTPRSGGRVLRNSKKRNDLRAEGERQRRTSRSPRM